MKILKNFSFWDKIRMFLASIGIGSEVTLFFSQTLPEWRVVAGFATILAIAITFFFKDEDDNGIVDMFENKK